MSQTASAMDGQQGQAEEYVPTGHEDMKTEGKQSKVPAKRTVHHTGTDTEVLDEYYMDGKKGPLDPDHCQRLKMINLWKTVKALTVHNVMKRYSEDKRSPRFLKVAILKNEKENEVIASVYFLTKDDAFKAAKGFSMEANWRWNKGYRAKVTHMDEFSIWRNGKLAIKDTTYLRPSQISQIPMSAC
tara:strand:+ start:92 stop:649 length:558 start_codon:yes stop_codon:yes gene_type:complete